MMKIISEKDIESIRKGDMAPLKAIFNANYVYCVNNLKEIFGCTETDASDHVMDAILVLREKIMMSDYTNNNLRSYLLTVASNKWKNKYKRDTRLIKYDPAIMESHLAATTTDNKESDYYRKKIMVIHQTIESMEDPCKSILKLNLIDGFSLDVVVTKIGYKSKAVLKTSKTRCMKKLRSLIKTTSL